jgi:hypothetical protein
MMIDRFGINLTQVIGFSSLAAAAIACLIASHRSTRCGARIWQLLGLINGIFAIEILAGSRHRIHDYANALLIAEGAYAQRRGAQELIILLLATIAMVCAVRFLLSRRLARSLRIAACLTIAVLALFAIETVSLHALDAIYYRPIGPVLLIGWMWAFASIGICWAALAIKG